MDPCQLLHNLYQVICSGLPLHSAAIIILQQGKAGLRARRAPDEGLIRNPQLSWGYRPARSVDGKATWCAFLPLPGCSPEAPSPVSSTPNSNIMETCLPCRILTVGLPEIPDMPSLLKYRGHMGKVASTVPQASATSPCLRLHLPMQAEYFKRATAI